MPKLKQPTPLEKMAFDVLLKCVVRCCNQLSDRRGDAVNDLRHAISVIKEYVCKRIPWPLLADFCCMFLDKFHSELRPTFHNKVAFEIIMDIEIIGLRFKGPMLAYFDPQDGHRFRRLIEMDMEYFPNILSISWINFHLNDLTKFIIPRHCTDLDLAVIGKNCSKLQIVEIKESKTLTDEGLRALSQCAELRVVHISGCPGVSYIGINNLLSVHEKLEDFAYAGRHHECKLVLSYFDTTAQCPSMNRFYLESDRLLYADLRFIDRKFPNLTYLGVNNIHINHLSTLKSLDKLTELSFATANIMNTFHRNIHDFQQTWTSLKSILPSIGVNMTSLNISRCEDFFLSQEDVNFIFNYCPNIENLNFDINTGFLIMPMFKKLTNLIVCCPLKSSIRDDNIFQPSIKFGQMLRLETLTFSELEVTARAVESIISDNLRFPNLFLIKTYGLTCDELLELDRNVRIKNLDVLIKNHQI